MKKGEDFRVGVHCDIYAEKWISLSKKVNQDFDSDRSMKISKLDSKFLKLKTYFAASLIQRTLIVFWLT